MKIKQYSVAFGEIFNEKRISRDVIGLQQSIQMNLAGKMIVKNSKSLCLPS